MKQRHTLGSAAVFALTVFAGSAAFAHGGHHSGGHHSGGHHSSHHSSGSHHGTAHHAAPHHSAPHHSAPHHAAPQQVGPSRPSHSHVAGQHSVPNHSFAQQNHSWHHHHHGHWNNGYWNNGTWYAGPWGVWDGSVASNDVAPWYYESFFNVEPEVAVQPENGPTVCRGFLGTRSKCRPLPCADRRLRASRNRWRPNLTVTSKKSHTRRPAARASDSGRKKSFQDRGANREILDVGLADGAVGGLRVGLQFGGVLRPWARVPRRRHASGRLPSRASSAQGPSRNSEARSKTRPQAGCETGCET